MSTSSRHLANPQMMYRERRAHECNVCDEGIYEKMVVQMESKDIHVGGKLIDSVRLVFEPRFISE